MSPSNFDSFFESPRGGFVESPRGARGGAIPAIVASGAFTTAGGDPATRVAQIPDVNGKWEALGTGLNSNGNDVLTFNGKLYVVGSFTTAGGSSALRAASWDGSNWAALGTGLNGAANEMAIYDGKLAVAGTFNFAGGTLTNRIALWNGSSWSKLVPAEAAGGAPLLEVEAVYVDSSGNLWAGGFFDNAIIGGVVTIRRIGYFDGTTWNEPGGGIPSAGGGRVRAIIEYDSDIWIGGNYSVTVGGVANTEHIARWDGSAWHAVKTSFTGTDIKAFAVYKGDLYAAGGFSSMNGVADTNNIARWDGSAWHAVDVGFDNAVFDLLVSGNHLVAGGSFTQDGNTVSNYSRIAAWDGSSWTEVDDGTNSTVTALGLNEI